MALTPRIGLDFLCTHALLCTRMNGNAARLIKHKYMKSNILIYEVTYLPRKATVQGVIEGEI
jgi:hypothetical protein